MTESAVPSSSLGFFFGPGFPLGLEKDSVAWPALRLVPDLGAGKPLRRGVSAADVPGAGVDAASEALSTDDGGTGRSAEDEAGDEGSFSLTGGLALVLFFLVAFSFTSGLANRLSSSGDNLRMTIALGAADRLERPFVVDVAAAIDFI